MIRIPRRLIRQLRTILSKSVCYKAPKATPVPIVLQSGPDGLAIHAQRGEVGLIYRKPTPSAPSALALPYTALEEFEGNDDTPVEVEPDGKDRIVARWTDRGSPRAAAFEGKLSLNDTRLPALPQRLVTMPEDFLRVLDCLMRTAATESPRFALNRIQVRGRRGELAATDGRQLLIQRGIQFPFQNDFLIPKTAVFGCRDLPHELPARVSATGEHFWVQVGDWGLFLSIDRNGRFPAVDTVIPKDKPAATWQVADEEASYLIRCLPSLPGSKDENTPVTIELHSPVTIRAKATDTKARQTEVVLENSARTGMAFRVATSREYLLRALQLGFREFHFQSADASVCCRDDRRTYVWMPLAKTLALPARPDALRVRPKSEASTVPIFQTEHVHEFTAFQEAGGCCACGSSHTCGGPCNDTAAEQRRRVFHHRRGPGPAGCASRCVSADQPAVACAQAPASATSTRRYDARFAAPTPAGRGMNAPFWFEEQRRSL